MLDRILPLAIAAAETAGERLYAEFHRQGGPRGSGSKAPVDVEMEEALRAALQQALDCDFLGEETGLAKGAVAGYRWLVDPHDGTSDFLKGSRGSSVSIGLLRGSTPVLGVVHSPTSPDRGRETIAWAEGAGPITRNGIPVATNLSNRRLERGEFVWCTESSSLRPAVFARNVAPARFIAMTSIAHRLARVAAGDGVAAVSAHGVHEYDIAAGAALLRGAGGVLLDAEGREIAFTGGEKARVTGCAGGAPEAARQLARVAWPRVHEVPKLAPRVNLRWPRIADEAMLARAQGCLLGQAIGDSLGSLVEFRGASDIAREFPDGVRELADGGVRETLAGQPTDDTELALTLARSLLREGRHDPSAVFDAYAAWMNSSPFDIDGTTRTGLLGRANADSEANGSLMRVSPIGIWAAGDPTRAANAASEDSLLTHPNTYCVEACAAYTAAIAAGIATGDREAMLGAARRSSSSMVAGVIARAAGGERPLDYRHDQGWVQIALQNAFWQLFHAPDFERGVIASVSAGGDTDTNGAIAGALLGALYGRDAVPQRWLLPVLACRPGADSGARQLRPMAYWPDDVLDVAEGLLQLAAKR